MSFFSCLKHDGKTSRYLSYLVCYENTCFCRLLCHSKPARYSTTIAHWLWGCEKSLFLAFCGIQRNWLLKWRMAVSVLPWNFSKWATVTPHIYTFTNFWLIGHLLKQSQWLHTCQKLLSRFQHPGSAFTLTCVWLPSTGKNKGYWEALKCLWNADLGNLMTKNVLFLPSCAKVLHCVREQE